MHGVNDVWEALKEFEEQHPECFSQKPRSVFEPPYRLPGVPVPYETAMPDRIVFHPEDLPSVPVEFIQACGTVGIEVTSFAYMMKGKFLLMGRAAEAMNRVLFQKDVQAAMKENHTFLELLKCNGLL